MQKASSIRTIAALWFQAKRIIFGESFHFLLLRRLLSSKRHIFWPFSSRAIERPKKYFALVPISGYICHGGWKEPLASQNTFSKVQSLRRRSLLVDETLDVEAIGQEDDFAKYVVISSAQNPQNRFCVRLLIDQDDSSNVLLMAHSQHCPFSSTNILNNKDLAEKSHDSWSFNLTRISKHKKSSKYGAHRYVLCYVLVVQK